MSGVRKKYLPYFSTTYFKKDECVCLEGQSP